MSIQEIAAGGGGALLVLMTLVQVSPIKVNPWTAIGGIFKGVLKSMGNAFNGDVTAKLDKIEEAQEETKTLLDAHIRMDDERNADIHRARILQFNTDLLRNDGPVHTEEDFNEILYNIDCYERYCTEHPDYQNNRAVHAIRNINRVYDECMEKHNFL